VELKIGGAEEDRTPDLVIANDALSQLSYGPVTGRTVAASTESSSCYSNTLADHQIKLGVPVRGQQRNEC
jgi:hypothetical protein